MTKQIIDVKNSQIANEVGLDFGSVRVAGSFRQSDTSPRRAVVAFDEAKITLDQLGGLELNLGFIFAALALVRGTKDSGWLETTFVDDDVRIGRGNKGTMFVLTKDPDAVRP